MTPQVANDDDTIARVRAEMAQGTFHPLEIIPFFRRWPCSWQRDIVYTFIWNCLFGMAFYALNAVFTGRNPGMPVFVIHMVMSNVIGYTIHLLYSLGQAAGLEALSRRAGALGKTVYYAAIPIVAVMFGFWVMSFHVNLGIKGGGTWNAGIILSVAFSSLVISLTLSAVFFWRERAAVSDAILAREREKNERIERQAALANLRALQAQIEPHFLFNTLANVTGLIDPDPAKAKRMLESFIRFLRASLAATRAESTTLGAESELISAFLDVLTIRMGTRLRYEVDVPPDLAAFELPPMLVQPVVENAIKHGLEPKVDGGSVVVRARRDGESVSIEIADTGMGFAPTTTGGVGLTNLRDRLRLLYGDRASLEIRENPPAGTAITIRLPA